MDTIIRGDWSTRDNFSFRVSETEGWYRGFRALEIDEEKRQGTTKA
jgi:hypothetical protein